MKQHIEFYKGWNACIESIGKSIGVEQCKDIQQCETYYDGCNCIENEIVKLKEENEQLKLKNK
jgi:hypothetical protein